MSHSAIVVFTARSPKRVVREGGSAAWVLNASRAKNCEFLVCTQNQSNSWGDATQEHGSAFLIGRISSIEALPADQGQVRYLIGINEYAFVDISKVWQGWRNPVRYATLEDLGIDPALIAFKPMPPRSADPAADLWAEGSDDSLASADEGGCALTIAQAKAGLSATFGVPPECIEITIRG